MILEELLGGLVSIVSRLVFNAPRISPENLQRDYSLIFEENPERDEPYDGLIHREYEQAQVAELPYYEEDITFWGQNDIESRRNFCESLLRSLKTNFGLMMVAIFVLGFLIVGAVYLNLNTGNACYQWMQNNLEVPSQVQVVQMVGMVVFLLPTMLWFPVCIAMLWGFKEFRKNYLCCLCVIVLFTECITGIYNIFVFDKMALAEDSIWL